MKKWFILLAVVLSMVAISCSSPEGPFKNVHGEGPDGVFLTWEHETQDDGKTLIFYWHVENKTNESVDVRIAYGAFYKSGEKKGLHFYETIITEVDANSEKSGSRRSRVERDDWPRINWVEIVRFGPPPN